MDGSIERALGACEACTWFTSRACRVNCVVAVDVGGPLSPEALAPALAALQARHPLLRVRVDGGDPRALWFRATDRAIPLRVVEGGGWQAEVDAELELPIADEGPLARCVLVRSAGEASTLLFVFHHVIGDGLSGVGAVRDLLEVCGATLEGAAAPLLPLEPQGSLERHLPPAGGWLGRLWRIVKVFARILRGGEPKQIPRDGKAPYFERRARFGVEAIAGPIVAALAERAKREGTSVFASLHAALALAIAEELALPGRARINCGVPVNLRPQLAPPVGDSLGLYVALTPVVFDVAPSAPLWDVARTSKRLLGEAIARGDHLAIGSFFGALGVVMAFLARRRDPVTKTAAFIEGSGAPTFTLSNLGALSLPRRYGPLSLRGLRACAGGTLANHFAVAAATLGDVLECTFVWTDPLLSEERVRRVMQRARARLEEAVAAPELRTSAPGTPAALSVR